MTDRASQPAIRHSDSSPGDGSALSSGTLSLGARIGRFLYPSPAPRSVGGIFRWWEKRRLAFNLIVGGGGAVSLGAHGILNWMEGVADSPQLIGLLPVLLVANLCYTLGPLTESALHKVAGPDVKAVGPHLLRAGLALSVGVSFLLPMLAAGVRTAIIALAWLMGVLGVPFA